MKLKLLFIIFSVLLSSFSFGQDKIEADTGIMTFMGRIPQKTESNARLDHLLRLLFYNIQPVNNPKVGYMNLQGEILVNPKYNMGSDFFGTTANIIKDSVYGYVNKAGDEVLFQQFDETYFYYGDTGLAKKDGKYALINRQGELLTEFEFRMISFFGLEFFKGISSGENFNILNSKGEVIFNEDYTYDIKSHYFTADSLIIHEEIVNGQKLNGLVNLKEEIILKPTYESIRFINDDELFAVSHNNYWGFIDKKGNEIIPLVYEMIAFTINEDLIAVKKDNKWGYINRRNEVVIPLIYDHAHAFLEGLAFVKKGDLYGCIDKVNNVKIEFNLLPTRFSFFSDGLAVFKQEDKYGYIDQKGRVIIPAIYDNAFPFFRERANVEINGKAGQINTKGEEIIPIQYKQLWFASEDVIRFTN